MKVRIKMYNKRGMFHADGIYENGYVTVLRGSKISHCRGSNFKRAKKVVECRENNELIKNDILQEDIIFSSPSTAAQLVTDASTNGYESWKCVKTNKSLKDYIKNSESEE